MYITADGAESIETTLASKHHNIEVESVDVKKVQTIITNTPDGRMHLLTFFNKVEKSLAAEVAGRKDDIASIRAKMAKNRAYNAKARASMRKELMHRMAVNAKRAKAALDAQMRWTARTFAHYAAIENKRNSATMERSKKTRAIMRKNKAEHAKALHMAVLNQQRSLAALESATNAKIRATNKHIAMNGAQIKANAIAARKSLDKSMRRFDKNMSQMTAEAKAARGKLAQQSRMMNAKIRAIIAGKIRKITAQTSRQFHSVRARMAKDRHHADAQLASVTTRLNAALAANKALQNKRFAKTVKNLAAMRKESNDRIKKAKQFFKMNTLRLASVVKHQVMKLNNRVTTLQGTITKNQLLQAKINRNVNAELKRMVKLGNTREKKLHQGDKNLRKIMKKNAAAVAKEIHGMQVRFTNSIASIRKQMAKDRRMHEKQLGSSTKQLYTVLFNNKKKQAMANKELSAATFQARLAAKNELNLAKRSFAKRMAKMMKTVQKNERKVNKKMQHLTGVVDKNAVKDAKGRALLRMRSQSNRRELDAEIRKAIAAGEKRAQQVEKNMKKLNKQTRAQLNGQISTEIGVLSKRIKKDIADLREENKKARANLKMTIMGALNSAAKQAKKNLKNMVQWSNKKFMKLEKGFAANQKAGAAGRTALRNRIKRNHKAMKRGIKDAVLAQSKALMTLKSETNRKIKKANNDLTAQGKLMEKNAREVKAKMSANEKNLKVKIANARKAAKAQLKGANSASKERKVKSLSLINKSLKAAKKRMDATFGRVYIQMGKDRAAISQKMGANFKRLNAALAKNIALQQVQFKKTVKNLKAARAAASKQVSDEKKAFTMRLNGLMSTLKAQEKKLIGEVGVVSDMNTAARKQQAKVNRRVDATIKKIRAVANQRHSAAKRARATIRKVMNANKAIAAREVKALAASAQTRIQKLRTHQDNLVRDQARALKSATRTMVGRIGDATAKQFITNKKLKKSLNFAKAAARIALRSAKTEFKTRLLTLSNTVVANRAKFEKGLKRVTGVAHSWKVKSAKDRRLIRQEVKAMGIDLNSKLTVAIQQGIAKARRAERLANNNMAKTKKQLSVEMAARTERMADNVFRSMNKDRQAIANNYLSVKGYCGTAMHAIVKFQQGKGGRSLSSIGDFLQQVAFASKLRTKKARGPANGAKSVTLPFSGKKIKGLNSVNKINGLVAEYSKIYSVVQMRYTMGIGKYLLGKLAVSMQKKGILVVHKKAGQAGRHVSVDGKTLGLSSQVGAFTSLSVKLKDYTNTLARMSAKLPKKSIVHKLSVPPPQWNGK
jgi:hypothetical protein